MPECRNCGQFVTKRYMRVFAPDELEGDGEVRACPYCTKIRDGAEVRTARGRGASYQDGEIQ